MSMPKILYFYTRLSSFVQKDIDILSPAFDIEEFEFNAVPKSRTPFLFIKQLNFLLFNIRKSDIIICQFGGYHSLLPVLFAKLARKPSLIITGGTDCVSFPSINYGNFHKKYLGLFTKWSYNLASHISPVHESLLLRDYTYQDDDYPQQGLLFFCKGLRTPSTVIYNGYDPKKWFRNSEKIANTFLTVAAGIEPFTLKLKGIDMILEVAVRLPESHFTIIGVPNGYPLNVKSKNVTTVPQVKNAELIDYYSRNEFYLQLSMSEGFPNALSEAMLCECIPIVSNVGSMAEIVGESGFILKRRDLNLFQSEIEGALKSNKKNLAAEARKRIANNYSEERRKSELHNLVKDLLKPF